MADYWKSNAKFYCRFCKIYITDNKSTRNIHDQGTKHKENVERFLRDQSQRGRDKEAETARMNKQMEAIEKAALKQYQLDVEAGLVQPSSTAPPSASAGPLTIVGDAGSKKPIEKALTTRTSEAASQAKEAVPASSTEESTEKEPEAELVKPVKVVDETIGQPGEWETVTVPTYSEEGARSRGGRNQNNSSSKQDDSGVHYVAGADDDDGAVDPEDLRGFKIVEKTYPVDVDPENEKEDGDAGEVVFKKRKGGAGKARNIRRKL